MQEFHPMNTHDKSEYQEENDQDNVEPILAKNKGFLFLIEFDFLGQQENPPRIHAQQIEADIVQRRPVNDGIVQDDQGHPEDKDTEEVICTAELSIRPLANKFPFTLHLDPSIQC